jgi:hypothetical protein
MLCRNSIRRSGGWYVGMDLLVVDLVLIGGKGEAWEHHIMHCMSLNRLTVDNALFFDDVASRVDRGHWDS